ncbi:hypothetical protein D3093_33360 (plasmid) [Azospirillum argentinense]|uniref:Secretin N-terminal domain-containing protein n=1 Tax=Azospirillum argentinense TaxID=2970906 RepID=A0A4D8PNS9_9PROT|nr:secretin N-terminal domain-containing protein [Azospirillum argentinense]QCO00144.1 hypothetical protein D3093_33360 [Azospirillum argentinense]
MPFHAARLGGCLLAAAAAALGGCTALDAKRTANAQAHDAAALTAVAQRPARVAAADPLRESRGAYGGSIFTPSVHGDPLPARLEGPTGFGFSSQVGMTVHELAAAFTAETGVPVRVRDAALTPAPGAAGTPSGNPGPNAEIAALIANSNANLLPGLGAAAAAPATGAGASLRSGQPTMVFDFPAGPFSRALSTLAGRFGMEWEYRGGAVELFRYVTRSFQIAALPTTNTYTVSSGGSGGGGGGENRQAGGDTGSSASTGLSQEATSSVQLKFWDELRETLSTVAGTDSRIATSPSTGTVTVTATPGAMRSVSRFIAETNRRLSRTVAITVQVLSVRLEDSDAYGLDLDLLFRQADLNLRFTGPPSGLGTGTGSATIGIIDSAGSNFRGSSLAVQALTGTQRAVVDSGESVTTSNNRLATKRVVLRNDYVRSAGSAVTSGGGAETDIRTVTRETGFIATFLPRIQEDGKILLQYGISLSDPSIFEPFETGGVTVQLERGSASEASNEIALPSGATLVVSSFASNRTTSDARGTGNPYNLLLGGGISGGVERRQVIVLITPVELADGLRADDGTGKWALPDMPEGLRP